MIANVRAPRAEQEEIRLNNTSTPFLGKSGSSGRAVRVIKFVAAAFVIAFVAKYTLEALSQIFWEDKKKLVEGTLQILKTQKADNFRGCDDMSKQSREHFERQLAKTSSYLSDVGLPREVIE